MAIAIWQRFAFLQALSDKFNLALAQFVHKLPLPFSRQFLGNFSAIG